MVSQICVLAQSLSSNGSSTGMIVGAVILAFIFIVCLMLARLYRKVGPNQVLIVYGARFRVVTGGGTIVWPMIERCEYFSLELMNINIDRIYTVTGVPINVDGVAQIKVKGDEVSIRTAAERFLSMNVRQIMEVAKQTMEGHLRAIVGTLTVEEIYKDRDAFATKVQEVAAGDMANLGLVIDSFTLRDIQDEQGYLEALGRPRIAQVKRDAIIAEAEAKRDSDIKAAQANQAGREAEFAAQTEIALANRGFETKSAEYQAAINSKKAEADLAYDLEKNKVNQLVKAEEMQIQVIEREKAIEIQEREIRRREKELSATVKAPADAERYRVEAIAQASKSKLQAEAEGEASAKRSIGEGEADARRARGMADADVIAATGASEAGAMEKKAAAWQMYNQAAVIQMVVEKLPELAGQIAAPLSRMDKMVVISNSGDGGSAGASKVTKDITEIIAQLPPVLQALSGLDLSQLIANLPQLRQTPGGARPTPEPARTTKA
jgi:flotillin